MNNRQIGLFVGAGTALGVAILIATGAATAPNPIQYNESTTNSPAKFPALLPTSPNFMNGVGKLGGTDGTVVEGGGGFGFNNTILIWTNNFYFQTNPVTANTLNVSLSDSVTNCSADPTISALAAVTNGLGFGTRLVVLANGANRTLSITAPNVHVYPSGSLVVTNGSFGVLSVGGIGGTYTGAVFLAFP